MARRKGREGEGRGRVVLYREMHRSQSRSLKSQNHTWRFIAQRGCEPSYTRLRIPIHTYILSHGNSPSVDLSGTLFLVSARGIPRCGSTASFAFAISTWGEACPMSG